MISKDLLDMAKAHMNDTVQFQCVSELATLASQANDYFTAVSDIIWIYDQIKAPSDKARVKPYIKKRLEQYSQSIESIIKGVNINLSYLTIAGIAATGTRLRDELREGQSLLETMKIR